MRSAVIIAAVLALAGCDSLGRPTMTDAEVAAAAARCESFGLRGYAWFNERRGRMHVVSVTCVPQGHPSNR